MTEDKYQLIPATLRLTRAMWKALDAEAKKRAMARNSVIALIVHEWIKKQK